MIFLNNLKRNENYLVKRTTNKSVVILGQEKNLLPTIRLWILVMVAFVILFDSMTKIKDLT